MENIPAYKQIKIKVGDKEIIAREISVSLFHKIENKIVEDNALNIVKECCLNINQEGIDDLGFSSIQRIHEIIMELSFGESGSEKKEEAEKK